MTFFEIDWGLLSFDGYPALSDILASVALTFFAYLGFSVITVILDLVWKRVRGVPLPTAARVS